MGLSFLKCHKKPPVCVVLSSSKSRHHNPCLFVSAIALIAERTLGQSLFLLLDSRKRKSKSLENTTKSMPVPNFQLTIARNAIKLFFKTPRRLHFMVCVSNPLRTSKERHQTPK